MTGDKTNIHQQGNFGVGVNQGTINNYLSSPPDPYAKGIPNNLEWTNQKLFGREEDLKKLHQEFQSNDRVAIVGMVGVGKTKLAVQYAKNHLEQTYSGGICWVEHSDDRDKIIKKITDFAKGPLHLNSEKLNNQDEEEQVNSCWEHWKQIKREKDDILLVLDGVTNYEDIEDIIKQFPFKVLITTETEKYLPSDLVFPLKALNPEAALEFLESRVTKRPERVNKHLEDAKEICKWLENLPLSLKLVGDYLNKINDQSLREMLKDLKEGGFSRWKDLGKRVNRKEERQLTLVLNQSWKKLSPKGKQLACLLSLFALEPIPWSLVEEVIEKNSHKDKKPLIQTLLLVLKWVINKLFKPKSSKPFSIFQTVFDNLASNMKKLREEDRGDLIEFSLLQDTGGESYKLHSIIRQFLREKLKLECKYWKEDMERGFCQAMVTVVASKIPSKPTYEKLENLAPKIPHLEETATDFTKYLSDKDLILPFLALGRFYEGKSLYFQAEKWYKKKALESIKERLKERFSFFGLDYIVKRQLKLHEAKILNSLAFLYFLQKRYDEAQKLYEEALKTGEKLGKKALDVIAQTRDGLGYLYSSLGKYDEAKPMLFSALKLREKALKKQASKSEKDLLEKRLDMIRTWSRLAFLFREQYLFEEAEKYYLKVLKFAEKNLNNYNLILSEVNNNLASSYQAIGDKLNYKNDNENAKKYHEKAEKLYLEALKIYEPHQENKSLPLAIGRK